MDRQILPKNDRGKMITKAIAIGACLLGGFFYLRWWLQPSVTLQEVRTARVEKGDLATGIRATGTLQPSEETSLTNRLNGQIEKVYAEPGQPVEKGDLILKLETRTQEVEVSRLRDKLSQKRSEKEQKELVYKKNHLELIRNKELENLEEKARKAAYDRVTKLFEEGLTSRQEVDEKHLLWQKSQVQLNHLEQSFQNLKATHDSEISQVQSETTLLERDLQEAEHLLANAEVRAPGSGMLTYLLDEPGRSVQQGELLAKIADLTRFRVEASLSDYYAPQIKAGLAVDIEMNQHHLDGQIERILPKVEAGALKVWVRLEQPDHPALLPSLRVQAHVLTDFKSDVVKVRKGPAFNGSGQQTVFVIEGSQAFRRDIQLGGENHLEIEVLEGLEPGEEIIISNTESLEKHAKIKVRS